MPFFFKYKRWKKVRLCLQLKLKKKNRILDRDKDF